MKKLNMCVLAVLIFSGVNWGLWGLFEFNLVSYVIINSWITRLFYILMGVSGIYALLLWKNFVPKKGKSK